MKDEDIKAGAKLVNIEMIEAPDQRVAKFSIWNVAGRGRGSNVCRMHCEAAGYTSDMLADNVVNRFVLVDDPILFAFGYLDFEIRHPLRDCGACWNQVSPTEYGFTVSAKVGTQQTLIKHLGYDGHILLTNMDKAGMVGYRPATHSTIIRFNGLGECIAAMPITTLDRLFDGEPRIKQMEPRLHPVYTVDEWKKAIEDGCLAGYHDWLSMQPRIEHTYCFEVMITVSARPDQMDLVETLNNNLCQAIEDCVEVGRIYDEIKSVSVSHTECKDAE